MSNNEDESVEQTPKKLVYEAYEQAAEERQRVSVAPLVPDSQLSTELAEVQYHAAILEYFNRLKPHLPSRDYWWNDVELWNEPLNGERHQLAAAFARYYGVEETQALGLLDALETNDNWPEIQPRADNTARGLKNLVHWRERSELVEQETDDVFGGHETELVEVHQHLPRKIAMRVHDALDGAASDLGYNTRPNKDIAQTELDEDEYEVTGVDTK